MTVEYPSGVGLKLDWPAERVLRITLSRGKMNTLDWEMHHALAGIWRLIDADPRVSVAIITGEGRAFCAGGDFEMERRGIADYKYRTSMWKDSRDLVMNILECNKPIVSAINGTAAGGGLVCAIMADVSIIAKSAKLVDGHTKVGLAAGDYSSFLWPLLCGMAKSKYYLMTSKPLFAEEAERIGLVSMCVEDEQLQEKALEVAKELANGSQAAVRWTKYALNNWMRTHWPIFDTSLALEVLGFGGPDLPEGMAAIEQKRPPRFDPDSTV